MLKVKNSKGVGPIKYPCGSSWGRWFWEFDYRADDRCAVSHLFDELRRVEELAAAVNYLLPLFELKHRKWHHQVSAAEPEIIK